MSQNQEPEDVLEFAAALGVELYEWQAKICITIEQAAKLTRKKIAVRAPNGVGKTQRIIALSALRWLQRFPRGRVVVTSYDARQVSDQLWPALRAQAAKFPFWKWSDAEHMINSREGGRIRAFTTDDPGRAEGFHADADCPLLIVVDEAKSVDPEIIKAIDRCSYNVLLYISSPGLKQGPFYDAFTANRESFITFAAGLADCPHIAKEKIADIINTYGENAPYTRSTLYGEFMAEDESSRFAVSLQCLQELLQNPPRSALSSSDRSAFCDFAAGGDENVIAVRSGNTLVSLICWRGNDTMASVGRFILEFRKAGLRPDQIYGDAGGLGTPMLDALREAGWPIGRFNFGQRAMNDRIYVNRATEIWTSLGQQIAQGEIVLINDPVLVGQLTSRKLVLDSRGRGKLESKDDLRSRGLKSPDRGDATAAVFGLGTSRNFINSLNPRREAFAESSNPMAALDAWEAREPVTKHRETWEEAQATEMGSWPGW